VQAALTVSLAKPLRGEPNSVSHGKAHVSKARHVATSFRLLLDETHHDADSNSSPLRRTIENQNNPSSQGAEERGQCFIPLLSEAAETSGPRSFLGGEARCVPYRAWISKQILERSGEE